MNVYKKALLGIVTGVIILVLISSLMVLNNHGMNPPGLEDSKFPFFALFPGWFAIFIPILARKRREEQKLEVIN